MSQVLSSYSDDVLIIGAGIIGLCLAKTLKERHPQLKIRIIDKEAHLGAHASGRNSGVLHAGFYYTADSLKARFSREGNARWQEYCKTHKLPLDRCGKVVVASNEQEFSSFEELLRRAQKNQVSLLEITSREAQDLQPGLTPKGRYAFAKETAAIDPNGIMAQLAKDLVKAGVIIEHQTAFIGLSPQGLKTSQGLRRAGYIVNTAGLYADKIAKMFGFARNYSILPFKGLYLYLKPDALPLRTHIYPVPNLKNPFLGVHFTRSHSGAKVGPTAIPAFWREQYEGFHGFKWRECMAILYREARLFLGNHFQFRSLALEEMKKYRRSVLAKQARALVPSFAEQDFAAWGRPGIRAQLVDVEKGQLVQDFLIEKDKKSLHVLNAISPAFTCALPFSEHLADEAGFHP